MKNIILKIFDAIETIIIEGSIKSLLLGSLVGFIAEIYFWDKTGRWETITIHGAISKLQGSPIPLFDLPAHPGMQKLLNYIMSSSLPVSFFIAAIALSFIVDKLCDHSYSE